MATEADKEFLEFLIKSIVDHPEDVKIDRKVDEMGVLLTLLVSPKDMGQVVGRGGNTAKAIRSLLRIVGIKHNARVNLKIEEPEGSDYVRNVSTSTTNSNVTTTVEQVIDDIKNDL
ncbi:MAG: KH domain-containing protein [bacterium]